MDFDIDRRKLLKATGAGIATATITTGTAGAVTNLADLPGDGTQQNPYELSSFNDLLAIDQDLTANYVLTDDIDFGAGSPIAPLSFDDSGYGSATVRFTGALDGQGHEIRDFEIDGASVYEGGGLFETIGAGGVVKNLDIVNIYVVGDSFVGGLAGKFDGGADGEIKNVSVTGGVESNGVYTFSNPACAGGLVGLMDSGTVTESSSSAGVGGEQNVGGAIGKMNGGEVARTYAEGDVIFDGTVALSNEGGFVGLLEGGSIKKAYARGNVFGSDWVGGFVGQDNGGVGSIEEVYSTGQVASFTDGAVGGLAGFSGIAVEEEGVSVLGVTNGYWDEEASGVPISNGGTPLTTDEMTGDDASDNMTGFDFGGTWVETVEYPVLKWQVEKNPELALDYEEFLERRELGRGEEDKQPPKSSDRGRGQTRRQSPDRSDRRRKRGR